MFQTNSGDTYCTIAAGTTSCTAPPLLVEGGESCTSKFTEDGAMEGGLLFSYEAWSFQPSLKSSYDTATAERPVRRVGQVGLSRPAARG